MKSINYGAVEHVAGNPFAQSLAVSEEKIQPQATDSYMHGAPDDRNYWPNKSVKFSLDKIKEEQIGL